MPQINFDPCEEVVIVMGREEAHTLNNLLCRVAKMDKMQPDRASCHAFVSAYAETCTRDRYEEKQL